MKNTSNSNLNETWFHLKTKSSIKKILESAIIKKTPLKITIGNTKTGEIYETKSGIVTRTHGPAKRPLLQTKNQKQSEVLLEHLIIAIINLTTKNTIYPLPPQNKTEDKKTTGAKPKF